MKEETEIVTETMNFTRFFITFISVSMGGTFLLANIGVMTGEPNIGLVGLVLFIIIPFISIRKIMLFFTRRVKIVFFENHFSLTMMKLNTGLRISEDQFFYQDIRLCTINNSAHGKTSSIYLNLINIGEKKFVFNNLKGVDIGNVGEIIYNNIKMRKPDIILRPTFFASNNGKTYIIGMAILLAILLFLHVFYSPQTSPFTFFISIFFYIIILAQRKKEIEGFKRLRDE